MGVQLGQEIERFFSQLRRSRSSVLLLDYDGTLAPFSTDRGSARPYNGVPRLVQMIMANGKTRVVLVSGRPAKEVRSLLGITPPPEIWGMHGLQRFRPDGRCEMAELTTSEKSAIAKARSWLKSQGLWKQAETKPASIAVHWRGLPSAIAEEIQRKVTTAWIPLASLGNMSLLEFDGGIELRPARGNKGQAVFVIMKEVAIGVPIAYLGDDATDEDAFRALAYRGLTVLVRPEWRETSAKVWIRPPRELLTFFENWLRCLRSVG